MLHILSATQNIKWTLKAVAQKASLKIPGKNGRLLEPKLLNQISNRIIDENIFQSVSKKEEEVKKLKEKVSDIVHQEDKTKQAKLKYVHFSSHS